MNRIKTLSIPLVSALLASAAVPASAQVALEVSSQKTYRQSKNGIFFRGGSFNVDFSDGSIFSVGGCNWVQYYAPGFFRGVCSEGTTALITGTGVNADPVDYPYLLVTALQPAIAIEPRKPDLIKLTAAPASDLPRPLGGFSDNSLSLFYNLHTSSVSEYIITKYSMERQYSKKERSRFEGEIVPGAYRYSFPRLRAPQQPAPITAVIYPMAEGLYTKNNKEDGFIFTSVSEKSKWTGGFAELSYRRPNVIRWKGLNPSTVFAVTDDLYIALREMQNPNDPNSAVAGVTRSIFPSFENGGDARVILQNPYVTSFTLPPIFNSGTRGILEISLQRNFQTSGVTYDFSTRKFQIPVSVVDRYSEYGEVIFPSKKTVPDILEDTDKDGYNNLTEWILDSNAALPGSIPAAPVPVTLPPLTDPIFGPLGTVEYGFTINKKLGTLPRVKYLLQRSTDNGKTWEKFVSDANWSVLNVPYIQNGTKVVELQVRSLVESNPKTIPPTYVQPAGTQGHIYRVKITLAK